MSTTKRASIAKKKNSAPMEAFIAKNRTSYPQNSWVVFTKDSQGKRVKPRVLSGSLSRDNARNSYAKTNSVNIQETRSRRVRNY